MAKTIKFNLICDDHPVRTLDDLREHFSIEDVLKYYQSGLLQKWLSVRGYEKELKAVTALSDTGDLEIIKKLIRIFEIETDEAAIEQGVYILEYDRSYKEQLSHYEDKKIGAEQMVLNYEEEFEKLIGIILQNSCDIALIKATIQEINDHYQAQFDINYRKIFYAFYEYAPVALFIMLLFDHMRQFYLTFDFAGNPYKEAPSIIVNRTADDEKTKVMLKKYDDSMAKLLVADRAQMYGRLCELNTAEKLKTIFGNHLKSFSGLTDNYWKDLASHGCRCMILRMDSAIVTRPTTRTTRTTRTSTIRTANVRASGKKEQMLDPSIVNNRFIILDGIDYRSDNISQTIYYLEG